MLAVFAVGVLLYFVMPNILSVMKKAVTVIVVAAALTALYVVNGGDWGNVFIAIIEMGAVVVNWLSDQFVSIWNAIEARFL